MSASISYASLAINVLQGIVNYVKEYQIKEVPPDKELFCFNVNMLFQEIL